MPASSASLLLGFALFCAGAAVCCSFLPPASADAFLNLDSVEARHVRSVPHDANSPAPEPKTAAGGRLIGTFVAPCSDGSYFNPVAENYVNVSSMKTLRYNDDGTFQIDVTEYIAEYEKNRCKPSETEVFAKWEMNGTIEYRGQNKIDPSVTNAIWTHEFSRWTFPNSFGSETNSAVAAMNKDCPCGGVWEEGVTREIDGDDCRQPAPHEEVFYLCNFVMGRPGYAVYKWLDSNTYVSSAIQFDSVTGWNGHPSTNDKHKVIESGVHDPDDCTYIVWNECGPGIKDAHKTCRGCTGLECEGCLYLELPERTDPYAVATCCPCMWYFAESYSDPWMEIQC